MLQHISQTKFSIPYRTLQFGNLFVPEKGAAFDDRVYVLPDDLPGLSYLEDFSGRSLGNQRIAVF